MLKGLIFTLILSLLCLIGCTQSNSTPSWYQGTGKVKVLSTTGMIDDLVKEIGGDRIDHIPLIRGEVDPHSYELVKGDDEKIAFANLVISNGLNLEHGASLRYQLQKHRHVVQIGEEIKKISPDKILVVDGSLDPHIWMDISLWAQGVDSIVLALSQEDPEYAEIYAERGRELQKKMLQTHQEITNAMASLPSEKRYLVTSHDAFRYFTRAYLALGDDNWQKRCIAPEGLAPEGQLSSRDIQRVIDHLFSYQIQVVFSESNVSRDSLKKIISSCGYKGLNVRISEDSLYGDAMGGPGSGADTYLGMIRHNAAVLITNFLR